MQKNLNVLDFEKSLGDLDKNIAAFQNAGSRSQENEGVIGELKATRARLLEEIYSHLTPWDQVLLARHQNRPYTLDYIRMMCDEFIELHGDRRIGDDQAVVGGPARIGDRRVMVIGQQKGRDVKERVARNFGYPNPEGFRKALRLMKLAERLHMPVVTLVDTPGADANLGSEERGISEAIALNLFEMSVLRTPIVCAIIGEGGSGGALGLAVADRILMLEHSIYSVIAPEGCAAILETFGRNPERKNEAAAALRVAADSAKDLGLADEVLPEPLGAAHANSEEAAQTLKTALLRNIAELSQLPAEALLEQRYAKYRGMGMFDVAN